MPTRGTTLELEITFNKHNTFSTDSLSDPSSPTITITAPDNTTPISNQPLTQHSTGKYYYTLTTSSSWPKGHYTITISATYNSLPIKKTITKAFFLE